MSTTPSLPLLRDALAALRRRVRRDRELHELDARTLADIGIDASEIGSIDAESRGLARLTRRRIAVAPHPV
jgi:uncharacterized protein YjiS (DUF1127 family)